MKNSSKKYMLIKVMLGLTLTGAVVGVGLYAGGVFDSSTTPTINNKPVDPVVPKDPVDPVTPIDVVDPGGPVVNQNKQLPSVRNEHDIDCSYYRENEKVKEEFTLYPYKQYAEGMDAPNTIACLIVDETTREKNNYFPSFVFDGVTNELSTHDVDNDYGVNKAALILTSEAKTRRYKEARVNAKKITSYFLESISFGSELTFLDSVNISYSASTDNVRGVYTRYSSSVYGGQTGITGSSPSLVNNRRRINLELEEYKQELLPKGIIQRKLPTGHLYDSVEYPGLSFDLYQLGQTFAHEYGHHLTLFNKKRLTNSKTKTIGGDLRAKLQELFPSTGNSKREDFFKIYDYINNPTAGSYMKDSRNDLNEYDYQHLGIYRKYFSKNIVSLKDILKDEYTNSVSWQAKMRKSLQNLGNLDGNYYFSDLPTTIKSILRLENGKLGIVEAEYKKLRNEIYNGTIKNVFYYKLMLNSTPSYILVSNSFTKTNIETNNLNTESSYNTDRSVTIGDIFPDQKPVYNEGFEDKEKGRLSSCSDLPYNFASGSSVNYETFYFSGAARKRGGSKQVSNTEIDSVSKQADKDFLSFLKYIFSYSELLARLQSTTTFTYKDKRSQINGCSFNQDSQTKQIKQWRQKDTEAMHDYALLKAFDINVLENEDKTKKMSDYLVNEEEPTEYNKVKFKEIYFNQDDSETTKFIYSHNVVGKDPNTEETPAADEEVRHGNTVYMAANVKLRDPSKIGLVTIEFTTPSGEKVYRKAYDYDYNSYRNVVPGESGSYNSDLTTEYLNDDVNNRVELVFNIDTIQVKVDSAATSSSLLSTEFQTQKALEAYYGNITKVFIDLDEDGTYSDGDTQLSIA